MLQASKRVVVICSVSVLALTAALLTESGARAERTAAIAADQTGIGDWGAQRALGLKFGQTAVPTPARKPAMERLAQPKPAAEKKPAPAPAPAPQPTRTEVINFDNWVVTCQEFNKGPRKHICSMRLQVRRVQNGRTQVLMTWTIGLDDKNRALIVLNTPTGVAIEPGVELKPQKGAAHKLSYASCNRGECTATLPLDADLVRDLIASTEAQVIIRASNGRGITFTIPIKGFDPAYRALVK